MDEEILCKNLKACADQLVETNVYKLLPEIGTNIAYTVSGSLPAEVCDIPGRIRRVENGCCYVRDPKMGGSLYMAGTLLAIRKKFPEAQCVANFRSSPEILEACRELSLNMVDMPAVPGFWQLGNDYEVDLEKTIALAESLPDIITIPDRINLEKLVLVVGSSLEDFEKKVLSLNDLVCLKKRKRERIVREKNVREIVQHEFDALYDCNSRVLMLGSIPSPKSREVGFYYGHPQNRFWKVMALVLGDTEPRTIEEKKAMLLSHGIALWDVLERCSIVGASDTSIENVVPNDIAGFVKKTNVTRIFCTGATAHKFYQKYCAKQVGIDAVKLPSTSPANCAVSIEKLVEAYKSVL